MIEIELDDFFKCADLRGLELFEVAVEVGSEIGIYIGVISSIL